MTSYLTFYIGQYLADQYLFQQILQRAKSISPTEGGPISYKRNEQRAREWFRQQAYNISSANFNTLESNAGPFQRIQNLSINSIGKMYMFKYDAKWKDKLPYWDMYPVIYPIEFYSDSMLGINLHYLSPVQRAYFMNALYELEWSNKKFDKTTKLQLSYSILKESTRHKAFEPCLHKYLFSHVRSPFLYISPELWDYAALLPTQRFQKASSEQVWADSQFKISRS